MLTTVSNTAERPPLVRGLPLVGSAYPMATDPLKYLLSLYRSHGSVFRVKALQREICVLAGTDANLFVARDGYAHMGGGERWEGFRLSLGARELLPGLEGERHQKLRAFLKQGYTRNAAAANLTGMLNVVEDAIRRLRPGDSVPLVRLMCQLIVDQLGLVVVGRTSGDVFPDLVYFVQTLLSVTVIGRLPKVMLYTPRFRRAKQRVLTFARDIVAARRRESGEQKRDDLLSAMLAESDKDSDLFNELDVILNVVGPFIAGMDTATNTAAFLIYALLKHPDVMERVRAEADRGMGDPMMTLDGLHAMEALRYAVMETMRIYPITPGIARTVIHPFEFGGYRMKEREEVLVATSVTGFLPELFPRPYSFEIERYSAPRNEHQQKGAFAPWGLGPHSCLGVSIAEVQIMLNVAKIIHRLRLEIDPPDYELRPILSPTLTPGPTFRVRVASVRNS